MPTESPSALERLTAYLCSKPGSEHMDEEYAAFAARLLRQHAGEVVEAERAAALRAAADAYDAHHCPDSGSKGLRLPCEHTLHPAEWLRARADAIHPGSV